MLKRLSEIRRKPDSTVQDVALAAVEQISASGRCADAARVSRPLVKLYGFSLQTCESVLDALLAEGKVVKAERAGKPVYRKVSWDSIASCGVRASEGKIAAAWDSMQKEDATLEELGAFLVENDVCKDRDEILDVIREEAMDDKLTLIDLGDVTGEESSEEDCQEQDVPDIDLVKKEKIDNEGTEGTCIFKEILEEIPESQKRKEEVIDVSSDSSTIGPTRKRRKLKQSSKPVSLSGDDSSCQEAKEKTKEKAESEEELNEEDLDSEGDGDDETRQNVDGLYKPSIRIKKVPNQPLKKSGRVRSKRYDSNEYVFPSLKKKSNRRRCMKSENAEGKTIYSEFPKRRCGLQKCSICREPCRLSESPVRCRLCKSFAHSSCVEQEQLLFMSEPYDRTAWYCSHCRADKPANSFKATCVSCVMPTNKWLGSLVKCLSCGDHYHKTCISPRITNMMIGSWQCKNCAEKKAVKEVTIATKGVVSSNTVVIKGLHHMVSPEAIKTELTRKGYNVKKCVNAISRFKTPLNMFFVVLEDSSYNDKILGINRLLQSNVKVLRPFQLKSNSINSEEGKEKMMLMGMADEASSSSSEDIKSKRMEVQRKARMQIEERPVPDPDVPDPTLWTTEEVADYFATYFDDNVSKTFIEQDIDGYALKLMKRYDVLKGMGFKLGLGLRVLFHVKRLQIRTNDRTIIWADES
ncbi:uncharacterized protein LOC106673612 isoform X2 [Cimex lectularius]|uniref:Histone acetyltransferase n=1 Tax=Cimex lectularius TaxID=79782 RepID=A0A8I6SBW7_CIMLE|nr:uncharacterized protein LOC106673612 isoform X2 [Cimex lectularius]